MLKSLAVKQIPVVLLCGGKGIRLHEETEIRPKPLVDIGGRPIIWHIMRHYASFGYKDFILCLGYKGEMIKDYFLNYHFRELDFTITLGSKSLKRVQVHGQADADWNVTLANTGLEALTGARIYRVRHYVNSDIFMMTYGDGLANIDIKNLIAHHIKSKKIATVTAVAPPSRFGELQFEGIREGARVVRFKEKPEQAGLVNGGYFVLNRKIFDYLWDGDDCVFEGKPLETLVQQGQLGVYVHKGFWQCMDTRRDLDLLRGFWNSGSPPWRAKPPR